jgi:hypothetical protein
VTKRFGPERDAGSAHWNAGTSNSRGAVTIVSLRPYRRAPHRRTSCRNLTQRRTELAFVAAINLHLTGKMIHEWLGIALGAVVITHLLLHWQWIVKITRRLFGRVTAKARLKYVVNLLFFIAVVVVIFTGIMISESVVPSLGLSLGHSMLWKRVHTTASDIVLILIGVHVALHWRWVVNTTKSLFRRRRSATTTTVPALAPVTISNVDMNTMVEKGSQL